MKIFTLFSMIAAFLCFVQPVAAVVSPASAPSVESAAEQELAIEKEWKSLSKKEKKAKRKSIKKALKKAKADGVSTNTALLVLIGIFIPPLAMALYDGISKRFWISLLLTILFFIPGLIYTLVVILGGK